MQSYVRLYILTNHLLQLTSKPSAYVPVSEITRTYRWVVVDECGVGLSKNNDTCTCTPILVVIYRSFTPKLCLLSLIYRGIIAFEYYAPWINNRHAIFKSKGLTINLLRKTSPNFRRVSLRVWFVNRDCSVK